VRDFLEWYASASHDVQVDAQMVILLAMFCIWSCVKAFKPVSITITTAKEAAKQ